MAADTQLREMLDSLLAVEVKAAPGLAAKLIAPPGELYEPLVIHAHDGAVWLNDDGKVYCVTPEGSLEVVVSGLINPWSLRFVGNRLWVSDINGDFIYGKRELPDGFIVEVTAE